jgi:hypothetical protein
MRSKNTKRQASLCELRLAVRVRYMAPKISLPAFWFSRHLFFRFARFFQPSPHAILVS